MMKKYFFLVMALFMSAGFAFAADISNPNLLAQGFDDDNGDSGATFDATSQILTFNGAWTGMRWLFYGNEDQLAAEYQSVTIQIEPVDFYMEVVVTDWRDGADHTAHTQGINPGETTATVDISPATQIMVQGGDGATSVKIVAAYLTPKAGGGGTTGSPVLMELPDPDLAPTSTQPGWSIKGGTVSNDVLGVTIPAAKYFVIETEGVGNNPDSFGDVFFIVQGDGLGWTAIELGKSLDFPRAAGKTVSIAIDIKNVLGDNYDTFLGFSVWGQILLGYNNTLDDYGFKTAYLTTDFAKPADAVDLTGGTDFGFIFSGSVNDLSTGIPRIKAPVSQAYGVTGGIVVNAANQNVSIYGIDGNLLKQVAGATNQNIYMAKGLYIVKVGTSKAVKVLVR